MNRKLAARVATEFPNEKALKDYLKKHPGAKPQNHSVKGESKDENKPKDEGENKPKDGPVNVRVPEPPITNSGGKWKVHYISKDGIISVKTLDSEGSAKAFQSRVKSEHKKSLDDGLLEKTKKKVDEAKKKYEQEKRRAPPLSPIRDTYDKKGSAMSYRELNRRLAASERKVTADEG
jgi:hypothetical protein